MKDISGLPNVDAPTANLINGVMNDVTTPGDGTGTPVRVDWQSDLYYALIAIMNEAGITADDTAEGATSSQFKDAILRVARKQVQGPSYSNLLVKRNVGTPNSKVDIAYDKLWIEGVEDTSGTFTLDITASGLLGLDTGAEAADAWYYIWIIAKVDGTVSAILSASATAPTMPAGYTLKRLVSMVRNTSGDFVDFVQENERWGYVAPASVNIGNVAATNYLDLSVYIPLTIQEIKIFIKTNANKGGVKYLLDYKIAGSINNAYIDQYWCYISGQVISEYTYNSAFINLTTKNRGIAYFGIGTTANPDNQNNTCSVSSFKVPL